MGTVLAEPSGGQMGAATPRAGAGGGKEGKQDHTSSRTDRPAECASCRPSSPTPNRVGPVASQAALAPGTRGRQFLGRKGNGLGALHSLCTLFP